MAENKELKVSISSNLDATGFNQAQSKIKDLSSHADKLSASFKTFAGLAASLGAVTLFKQQITQAIDFADSLSKLSQKTGITADGLYSLSAAAKLSDVDFASLEGSLSKFSKGIGEASMGTGSAKDAFDRLGVSIRNQDGTLKDSFTLLVELSDKFQDMPNGASKATTAMELFGKSGAQMIPLLNSGSEALKEYLGVMDGETGKAAEQFNDSFTKIGLASDKVYMRFIKELSPSIKMLADDMDNATKSGDGLLNTLSKLGAESTKKGIELGYILKGVSENYGSLFKSIGNLWGVAGKNELSIDAIKKEFGLLASVTEKTFNATQAKVKAIRGDIDPTIQGLKEIENTLNKDTNNLKDLGLINVEEIEKQTKKANEELRKFNDEQFSIIAQNSEKSFKQLDAVKDWAKEEEESAKNAISSIKNMQDVMITYYDAIGDTQSAYYAKEAKLIDELKEQKLLTDTQINAIISANREKFRTEQFEKENKWFYDMFDNINKALDESFFDTMTGKFKSFGDWLKDFFSSIGSSIARGLSRTLAGSLTESLQGGIVNSFKSYGLFGGASLVGSTLSASDMNSIISSGATASGGKITTSGGTIIDQASGMVTNQGSDAMSILGTASSLKTAFGVLSGGISSSILTGFQSASGLLANLGLGGASSGLMSFGAGFANPFAYAGMSGLPTAMTAGSMASSGLLGGIGGYALGSLGDKIFGADTYAGTTGAIGGALGGLGASLGWWGGPIGIIAGSLLGSVLGGLFGKTKVTGQGIDIFGNATADYADGRYYTSYKKKSWFSSKSWENYTGFNAEELEAIKQTIGAYDYLLAQLGEYNDLVVAGGRFSNLQSFLDTNVVKAFLGSINPQNLDTIYQSWVDYAAQIDKTITEAISTAVGGYNTYKRGYTEWFLGSGTVEQLEFTANYLQKDFEALSTSLGAGSVTVDNFLSMYDAAIKENFTQDTIEAWASLGDALMKSTDAAKGYQEALDKLNGSTSYSLPIDTMLTKVNNSSSAIDIKQLVSGQNKQNDTVTNLLVQTVKTLQLILKEQQFGKKLIVEGLA